MQLCGYGCLERLVGNRYLLERAKRIFGNRDMSLEKVFDLANHGNRQAKHFWEETAAHIGNALVAVVNLLNPELIVLGGGVSNNFKFLSKTIYAIIRQRALKIPGRAVRIVRAQLGDDAGILGAQVLVRNQRFEN